MEDEVIIKGFIELIKNTPDIVEKFKELDASFPNIPLKTMGGKAFWLTLEEFNAWKLQRNSFTQHYRILDSNDIRQAWGNKKAMLRLFSEFNSIKIDIIKGSLSSMGGGKRNKKRRY